VTDHGIKSKAASLSIVLPIAALTFGLFSCTKTQQSSGDGQLAAIATPRFAKMNVNQYPITKNVCNPIGGVPDPRSNAGIKADLIYIEGTPAQAPQKIQDVLSNGTPADRTLFLSDLNIPTRRFELGFTNQLGETLKTNGGQTVVEWFALKMSTVLHLRPDQEEGLYEFSVLSDDGAILKIRNDGGTYDTVINNDGNHPTRLGCSPMVFEMKRDSQKLAQILYHQGPRYHISMVLMMRKIADLASNKPDVACGITGNSTWFDYLHNSTPQPAYTSLISRGWQPLDRDNYSLPASATFNPCKEGEVPVITVARVLEQSTTTITLSWHTDIPTTSQVTYKEPGALDWQLTTSDNVLRTDHTVTVTGLTPNTPYQLRPVAISDTYGKAVGDIIVYSTEL
jgi:hypothetical protein